MNEPVLAIGLMSGTSMDGIDAALIRTDGEALVEPLAAITRDYDADFRARLRGILGGVGEVAGVEAELTRLHGLAVADLLAVAGIGAEAVSVIGFHGHTILHQPDRGRTWQIGDGLTLAEATGIDVVNDLRQADMRGGGQGAPLVPVFHRALTSGVERPVAVLNIGGVANVTWIGAGADDLLAFDTGPGNALIDDWVLRGTGAVRDEGGALAAVGRVDGERLARLMAHPYFDKRPPKSLDRDDFAAHAAAVVTGLDAADGAALLTAFTAESVMAAARWFPESVTQWIVAGGGRHNATVMTALQARTNVPVGNADRHGWDGDALEAQAFAYLAVRSLDRRPITFPGTTGVAAPSAGGRLCFVRRRAS